MQFMNLKNVIVKHRLGLIDKLLLSILNHGSEVCDLLARQQLERVHISCCEELLCVSQQTQNNGIHGEKGRPTLINFRS